MHVGNFSCAAGEANYCFTYCSNPKNEMKILDYSVVVNSLLSGDMDLLSISDGLLQGSICADQLVAVYFFLYL